MTAELDMLAEREEPIHIESRWEKAQRELDALDVLAEYFFHRWGFYALQRCQSIVARFEGRREEREDPPCGPPPFLR